MLLSVHSSMKMYIALDQSPLQFGKFERRRIFTTPYRLVFLLFITKRLTGFVVF